MEDLTEFDLTKITANLNETLPKLKQLKSSSIPNTREKILDIQSGICPLCGNKVERPVLDHKHKFKKADSNGENGNGLVRGVLCSDCNSAEGKIHNAISRFVTRDPQKEIEFLKNLIKYYQDGYYPLIHPLEAPKEKDVSKSNFNKLSKLYKLKYPKKKPLVYPKSKKLTKQLKLLFKEFNINPYN